ncbi:hypothetical protein M137_1499 [Bacteroides fragilis str. S36L12]|nr:hypothetical protein M137_4826 [Bacteroides fragilis str. S36L12]EYA83594.1 hypothetical protein M137_4629 [Bacteroides fragilis str. S36L12]EYA86717.1 hypothetical protein M137_1499 [Bacteroides fragilis str. S36L12]
MNKATNHGYKSIRELKSFVASPAQPIISPSPFIRRYHCGRGDSDSKQVLKQLS